MEEDPPSVRRRELLAAAGALTTGCLGGGSASEIPGRDEPREPAGEGSGGGGGEDAESPRLEPVEYPDERCAVDARNVRDHPGWNAQVLHEDGSRAFLCTSGCMGAYYTAPSAFGVSEADVAGLWVTDHGTGETVDGTEAYYIFVGERGLIDMPAGRNPLPFADRGRAEGFTEGFGDLSTGDVERFSKVNLNRCVW
jgi:nitrous oxide reductase accessory protein NosL